MSNEVTRIEFARLRGIKPSYVTQLAREGRLVLTDDGKRVKVAESIARIEATRDPSKQGVADRHAAARSQAPVAAPAPAADPADKIGNSYQTARAVKERYAALQAKLDYEAAIGKYVLAAEAVAAVADGDTLIRTRFEALADTLAPRLAAISDEQQVRATLHDEIEIILGDLSRSFAQMTNNGA